MKCLSLLVVAITICFGCAQSAQTIKPDPSSVHHVDGVVQSLSGFEVIVALTLPEFKKTADTAVAEISHQIVQKGLFIEGLDIAIEKDLGEITKVTGNVITILHRKPVVYAIGQNVKLEIPKKKIAIVDFNVIRGGLKEAGVILMEQLSSSLIESKHYTVLERSKLNTIMEELKLIQSGLTEAIPEHMRPKLLIADMILTGTLAEIGDKYDINLRLLNVRTGQAIVAINVLSPLYKPSSMRDSSELNENFESTNYSWLLGPIAKQGMVLLDDNNGVLNTKQSLKMTYDFSSVSREKEFCITMKNIKKRDLSLYEGIEFYTKATYPIFGILNIHISDREDESMRNIWVAKFNADQNWKIVKIPFSQLFVIKRADIIREQGYKEGREIMDLSRIESIRFGTCNQENPLGAIWIDNIHFYKQ